MSPVRMLRFYAAVPVALICIFGALAVAISQETSVGRLDGRVVIEENGNPIEAPVYLTSIVKKNGDAAQYTTKSKRNGSFSFKEIPVGRYKLEATGQAHWMKPVNVTIDEGTTKHIEARLSPEGPRLDLLVHQHIFTPDERPRITCKGFLKANYLSVSIYRVDQDVFLTDNSRDLQGLLGIDSYYDANRRPTIDLSAKKVLSLVKSSDVRITTRDLEGIFIQRMPLPKLSPGLYVTEVNSAGLQRLGWIMVTSLGLVTKSAGSETLAYTVDLKTGRPVGSVDVGVYDGSKVVSSGKTGADGMLTLSRPASEDSESSATIIARRGESFAFLTSWLSSTEDSSRHVYAYTDRPVYRPGQRVHFKGITRQAERNGSYSVPASEPVSIEVRDPNDTLVYRITRRTDRFGSYSGSFSLNPETVSGYYTLVSTVGGGREEPIDFQVMSYRKPEFSVKVDFPRKQYVRGELVRAKVSATYYFGSPVTNAKVSCMITRSEYWLWGDEEDMADYYDWESEGGYEDYGGYGETVKELQVRTDGNGEAWIEFPATWDQPKENDTWESDQEFSVEASVIDRSGREASGNGSVIATRGDFSIEVTPERYVIVPGEKAGVSIRAMDYQKRPVRRKAIDVQVGLEDWSSGRYEFRKLRRQRLTTDASGQASLRIDVQDPGDLRIVARARDRRGNNIVGYGSVWSYAGASDYGYYGGRFPDLQITPDKKTYDVGDTASVLIKTDNPGATALVTVEGDRVYDSMTVRLKNNTTLVKLPVKSEYKPNFYIAVCFVKNKEFSEQQARAKVSLVPQTLNVKVEPNKRTYKPGEQAEYRIRVTDSKGKPAVAQLSVGVVDEAIYAIAEDYTTPILDHFYRRRPNRVQTSFSFPEIYLSDPDKAGAPAQDAPVKIRVRKKFLDTAFWAPSVVTGSDGTATVRFEMPDNLTTWRTTVRGITADTSCGQCTDTVLARQDLLVRLELPRFMVQKDASTVTTVVHNYTGKDQRATVSLSAPGMRIDGGSSRTVSVKNNGFERVDWRVTALAPGSYEVTAQASCSTDGDAMQLDLPVYPHGVEKVDIETGMISGTHTDRTTLTLSGDAITKVSKLKVRLAPSLASSMLGSLEYLAQYPYGCTEQTTSTFIPDVVISRTLKQLGMRNPTLEAELPDMVAKGLLRLYRFQLEDGGWSWCEYGKSDPWMTAYVCYGLILARNAGFSVNEQVLARGLDRLSQQVTSSARSEGGGASWPNAAQGQPLPLRTESREEVGTRAFGLYVLTLAGQRLDYDLITLAGKKKLDDETLALLTLAYAHMGKTDDAKAILDRLLAHSISESGMMHWSDYGGYWSNHVEVSALALQAMVSIAPNDPRTYQIVRWLMRERRGNSWYSTRDTAMALYAMSEFLKQSKELDPDSDVVIKLNGRTVGTRHFGQKSVLAPEFVITVPGRDLRKGRNELTISKAGTGNLYYSAQLTQWIAKDSITADSRPGLSVTRQYFRPSPRYYERLSNRYVGSAISGCRTGEIILVRLTVNTKSRLHRLMLEDYIPAGCEIIDKGHLEYWEWDYWYVGRDIRDEKVSFYIDEMDSGKHVIEYQIRAGISGGFHALPAQLFAMYEPDVRTSSGETEFTIR